MATPINPQQKITLLKKGDTRIGSATFWNELIKTANALRTMRVVAGDKNKFVISDENALLTVQGSDDREGFPSWWWAGEFDSAQDYSGGAVVMVSPGNSAEGTVVSGSKTTLAGMYVCIQATTASTAAQYPCWPLPNATVSNSLNFWMNISLYPTLIDICVEGVDTPYYINAQPSP